MPTRISHNLRLLAAALRSLLVMIVILGLAYPLALTGLAQVAFSSKANGSMVERDGAPVGSVLIGQSFTRPVLENGVPKTDADGNPVLEADPSYFQSRPAAAGSGYDPLSSGASNLGPESPDLVEAIEERRVTAAALDGVNGQIVPPDALTASGSGLDPHISPAYAAQQVARVARERGMDPAVIGQLLRKHTDGRALGFLGEPAVNVLSLNMALDGMSQ